MNPIMDNDIDLTVSDPEPDLLDEKQDVANITMDDAADPQLEPQEEVLSAKDHEVMKKKYFPQDPDLETIAETVHEFNITNWKNLDDKVHGPIFECGGIPWRILMFPFGNNTNKELASFYLEHAFEDKPDEDWYACVQFFFVLSNTKDSTIYFTNNNNVAHHRYHADAADWGFTRFVELRKAFSPNTFPQKRPLVEDGAATMTVFVRIIKDPTGVLWHDFVKYDSKKETGMVGLFNQGATCYLNSLLQSLYLTNTFRKAIYQIPTESDENPRANSAYALQRLFYSLQTSKTAVDTKELTEAFGWDSKQIFVQRDVQELSRILLDVMESRMKGTEAEKALPNLFVGTTKTFIKCINVDYESSGVQDFWDIQLNVRGNANLDESFKDEIQVETLEGENKYFAEGYGLRDAKKGSIFESFPPVLHLQLKRFEFNFQLETTTKINDKHEFPEVFDAEPYLSKDADRSEPWIYHLHGVLVQSGELDAGHYYAFLKPHKNGHFYKFDDDKVTRATKKEAIDDNFGGDFGSQPNGSTGQRNPYTWKWSKQRLMSAYMLVYIRESRLDEVLQEIQEIDVPPHLGAKLEEERIEAERREKERREAPLYMLLSVGTTDNFNSYQGFDIFPYTAQAGASPAALPKPYRLLKAMKLGDFNKMVANDLDVDPDLIRPWACVGRQNNTIRPDLPIDAPDASLEEVATKIGWKVPFRLWMEVASRDAKGKPDWVDFEAVSNTKNPAKPILLFLKYFDIEKQTLRGYGTIYIERHRRISELGPIILDRMGWPASTQIKLYEEIKALLIEPLKTSTTFALAELQDGDIICFQKVLPDAEMTALAQAGKCIEVPKFYEYLINRIKIKLVDRTDMDNVDRQFELELSRKMTYDQLAARVGEQLNVDPTYLRFSTVFATNNKPRPPIRRTLNQTLTSMLSNQSQLGGYGANPVKGDLLLYEVLELSLSELELKKALVITLLSEGITKEENYEILVPKNGVVGDFIEPLKKKAKLSDEAEQTLRFYEVRACKIYRELTEDVSVTAFNEFVSIYAEQLPQEEAEADATQDNAVYCFHFDKEPNKVHGVPFKFIVKPGELFKDTKLRLSNRTGIKGKQFEKIKFATVGRTTLHKLEYLNDDDVLADKITVSEDKLGLDHPNRSRNIFNRNDAMMIR